jgi:hypothetical protein
MNGGSPLPQEHETARAAQRRVEEKLAPCIPTRLGQGDDYGIDAYVQHVLPGIPPIRTAELFCLQIKGKVTPLEEMHSEQLKTAHLLNWSSYQIPVIIAVHCVASDQTRWRAATDIVSELDLRSNGWRARASVSVNFSESDARSDGTLHEWLNKVLVHLSDVAGGRTRFHVGVRSVLLTEMYHFGTSSVGQRGSLSDTPNGPPVVDFVSGMQWGQGEVDQNAVAATRVLAGALLLFDQVFFPVYHTIAAVATLGPELFRKLVEKQRLVPITHLGEGKLMFITDREGFGDVYFFKADETAITQEFGLTKDFARVVTAATRHLPVIANVSKELREVSKLAYIRDLLGLGYPRPQAKEPSWAAERLLRIGNVVRFYAIAEQLGVDIVEFEPGLARLALARWGSRVRFHRVYQALDELQASLHAAALPDIGLLTQQIGILRCVDISESAEGAAFRHWYWQAASEVLAQIGTLDGEIAARLKSLAGAQHPLPKEFFVQMTQDHRREGLAARPGGEAALERQMRFSAQRLQSEFSRLRLDLSNPLKECPCGSSATFESCCGRILAKGPPK